MCLGYCGGWIKLTYQWIGVGARNRGVQGDRKGFGLDKRPNNHVSQLIEGVGNQEFCCGHVGLEMLLDIPMHTSSCEMRVWSSMPRAESKENCEL